MRFVSLAAAAVVALAAAPAATAWTWPADGPVVHGFALGADPYAAGQHRGIDVGGTPGDPVRAPAGGRVSYAGNLPHYGRSLTIRTDDGWVVTLLHLGTLGVARGAVVPEGQTVATLGSSGEAEHEASSVHLGIRHADDEHGYVDPVSLLPPPPVAATPVPVVAPPPAPSPVAVAPGPVSVPVAAPTPAPAPAPEPAPAVPEPLVTPPEAPAPVTEPVSVPVAVRVVAPRTPVVPVAVPPRAARLPASSGPAPPTAPVTIHATRAVRAPASFTEAHRRPTAPVPPRKVTPAGRPVVRAPAHHVPAATPPGVPAGAAGRGPAGGSAEPRNRASGRPFVTWWLPALLVALVASGACAAVRRRRPAGGPVRVVGPCPLGRRAVARPACRRAPLHAPAVSCRPVPRAWARPRLRRLPRRARVAVTA